MLQDHLRELENKLEIKLKNPPNEPGIFIFEVDEEITVYIHDLEEGTYITCQLCEVPSKNREDIFILLSELNLMGQGSLGSIFGITEDSKYLTINHLIDYDVGFLQFYEVLEDFVNIAKITLDEIRAKA